MCRLVDMVSHSSNRAPPPIGLQTAHRRQRRPLPPLLTATPHRFPPTLPPQRHVASFTSELLGSEGAAQFAWSPGGNVLAVAGARVRRVGAARCQCALAAHCF